MSACLTEITLN